MARPKPVEEFVEIKFRCTRREWEDFSTRLAAGKAKPPFGAITAALRHFLRTYQPKPGLDLAVLDMGETPN